MTPSYTVRTAPELISAVPYLLGFHPTDSLVTVGIRDRRIILVSRHDLPPPDLAGPLGRELAGILTRQNIEKVTMLGYGAQPRVDPVGFAVAEAVRGVAIDVVDVLRVADSQYWSAIFDGDGCCPHPCPPAHSAFAVAATIAGHVALPDRAALLALVAPVTGAARAAITAATVRARTRAAILHAGPSGDRARQRAGRLAVRDAEARGRAGDTLTDDELAWLGVMLSNRHVRDYACERITPGPRPVALWTDVLRRVEPGYVPAAGVLLAYAAWLDGQGTLARAAIDRVLAHDPDYELARLLDEVLARGLPPQPMPSRPTMARS